MDNRYRLGGLENDRLLESLKALVRRENDSLSDMLAHLGELDERDYCLELGYSSLFNYCIEALGFSKSAAVRRRGCVGDFRRRSHGSRVASWSFRCCAP